MASGRSVRVGAAIAIVATLSTSVAPADAAVKEGRYRQSALKEDYTVQQWLTECGPTPQNSSVGGGETATLKLEGDELSIIGGGRVFRTNQCYDSMPNLTRKSHSRASDGGSWRSQCVTPDNDPRKAVLNTLITATSDAHVEMTETGRYEVVLDTGRCLADVRRTRSWDLVSDEVPPTAPPAVPTALAPRIEPRQTACDTPGEPTRLAVTPSRKLLRTGESFQFKAAVLDDRGCITRTATMWKLAAGTDAKIATVDVQGMVTIAKDAPEGSIEIVVTTVLNKETRVTVEITQPFHYEELLARSGLNANGENESASVVSIGSEAISGEGKADDRAKVRRMTFVGIVGFALAALAVAGVFLRRRAHRAKAIAHEVQERHEAKLRDAVERRRAQAEAHASQLRAHEESVKTAKAATDEGAKAATARAAARAAANAEMRVCPACGKQQRAPVQYCPTDGKALVPIARASSGPAGPSAAGERGLAPPPAKRGKICPTCGDRFEGAADFCGKDGTTLVLLN